MLSASKVCGCSGSGITEIQILTMSDETSDGSERVGS